MVARLFLAITAAFFVSPLPIELFSHSDFWGVVFILTFLSIGQMAV